jgi:putative ubiquitin-RnfH superfamily antitoxin RatB of RatAB toxin-antitoxin module
MLDEKINIEVCYISKTNTHLIKLIVDKNTSILDAIILSKLMDELTQDEWFDIKNVAIGIYGKKINPEDYRLKNFDRIEIYRRLITSPNQKRLERANNGKK